MRQLFVAQLLVLVLLGMPAFGQGKSSGPILVAPDAAVGVPSEAPAMRGRSFIPLHSTVIAGGGRTRVNFSGTLSIHNTSATAPLVIERIEYHNDAGARVEHFVANPFALRPYASAQVVIPQDDTRGGTGASFVVDWSASEEPAIEAVMVATQGVQAYSFVSVARRLARP